MVLKNFQNFSSEASVMADTPPSWLGPLLEKQTASFSNQLNKHLTQFVDHLTPLIDSARTGGGSNQSNDDLDVDDEPSAASSPAHRPNDTLDDFDEKYGHLVGLGVNADEEPYVANDDSSVLADDVNNNVDVDKVVKDLNASVDDDLIDVRSQVSNWDISSSLRSFITNNVDRPLPEEMLKHLKDDYVPPEELLKFFMPPKMPCRLFNIINRMKTKYAAKTEKSLYNGQKELLLSARPLISALAELKRFGPVVSAARKQLSISLMGIFSSSLQLSSARRENVRFLFKKSLAEVLFTYQPSHESLFGGSSFHSQLEKATKEAKLELSWSKPAPSFRSFRGSAQPKQDFYSRRTSKNFQQRPLKRQSSFQQSYPRRPAKKSRGGSSRKN